MKASVVKKSHTCRIVCPSKLLWWHKGRKKFTNVWFISNEKGYKVLFIRWILSNFILFVWKIRKMISHQIFFLNPKETGMMICSKKQRNHYNPNLRCPLVYREEWRSTGSLSLLVFSSNFISKYWISWITHTTTTKLTVICRWEDLYWPSRPVLTFVRTLDSLSLLWGEI